MPRRRPSSIAFVVLAASAAFGLVILTACVHTNALPLSTASTTYPPVSPSQVRVYRLASQVPGRYEELAIINASGSSSATDEPLMLDAMRKRAGQLGANAIILDAISEPSAGAKVAGAIFGVSAERKGKALAVYVFLPDAPVTVRPAAPAMPPIAAPVRVDTVRHP